jgi:hypothetical protein
MLQDLVQKLETFGVVRVDGKRIKVCIPSKCRNERIKVLEQLNNNFQDFSAVLLNDMPSYSSIGYVKIHDFRISVKSLPQQSSSSPGISNEHVLAQKINKYIKESGATNLIFLSDKNAVCYENVMNCRLTENRKLRKGRNKADMIVETQKNSYGVSIKQHDAERWESADTSHGTIALQQLNKALNDQKTSLLPVLDSAGAPMVRKDGRSVMRLENELFWCMDDQEVKKTIFGDDVCDGGAVVFNTFNDSHFSYDAASSTLTVACDRVYTVDAAIEPQDRPYWIIRNDITRNCRKLGIPGLRIESVFKSRIKYGVEI